MGLVTAWGGGQGQGGLTAVLVWWVHGAGGGGGPAVSGRERLVSGSDDHTIFLWDPIDGKKPIERMTGHQQVRRGPLRTQGLSRG